MQKFHTEIYNGTTTNQSGRLSIALWLFRITNTAAHGGQDGSDVGGCRIPAAAAAGNIFLFVIFMRGRHVLHSCWRTCSLLAARRSCDDSLHEGSLGVPDQQAPQCGHLLGPLQVGGGGGRRILHEGPGGRSHLRDRVRDVERVQLEDPARAKCAGAVDEYRIFVNKFRGGVVRSICKQGSRVSVYNIIR